MSARRYAPPWATKGYVLSFAAAAVAVALTVFIILSRLRFPFELEWMTGSILDHIERLKLGKSVYAEPTADWIPFLYPPGYYWLCSLLPTTQPAFLGPRLVAILGTLAATLGAVAMASQLVSRPRDRVLAAFLFIGTFTFVSHWFDIERVDGWFLALTAWASFAMMKQRGTVGALIAGTLIGLSCFFKQPGVLFFAAGAAVLAIRREKLPLLAFVGSFAVTFGALFLSLQRSSGGWFAYYVYKLPGSHGIDPKLISLFLVVDQSQAALFTLATFVVFARWLPFRGLKLPFGTRDRSRNIFAAYLGAAWAASASGRMHVGGFPNVDAFWLLYASVALACLVGSLDRSLLRRQRYLLSFAVHGLVALQCLRFVEDPSESLPEAKAFAHGEYLRHVVKGYEARGKEVFFLPEGHLSKERHAHSAALVDVYRSGVRVKSLDDDLRAKRFGAIVISDIAELDYRYVLGKKFDRELTMFRAVAENYAITKFLEPGPYHVVGHKMNPTWLLEPRETSLRGMTLDALEETLQHEGSLAIEATSLRRMEKAKRGEQVKDTFILD